MVIKNKWLKTIILTLVGSGAIEISLFLLGTLSSNRTVSEFVPWTFHTIWEIGALGAIAYLAKKCDIKPGAYYVALLFGAFIVAIVWIFIPDNLRTLEANYYGVESRISTASHIEGRYDERVEFDYALKVGYLYRKDDPELIREFSDAKRFNEYVRTKAFLFWQTGLAYGFDPFHIPAYDSAGKFLYRIELFFTVGPLVIVESFIKGLISIFPILMIAQLIRFIIRKEHIWWA
jgi:hypothetical protein